MLRKIKIQKANKKHAKNRNKNNKTKTEYLRSVVGKGVDAKERERIRKIFGEHLREGKEWGDTI